MIEHGTQRKEFDTSDKNKKWDTTNYKIIVTYLFIGSISQSRMMFFFVDYG